MSMGISQPSYYVTRLSIPQDIGPLACYAVPASRGEAENRQGEADRLAEAETKLCDERRDRYEDEM